VWLLQAQESEGKKNRWQRNSQNEKKKIYFLHLTDFKLFSHIEENQKIIVLFSASNFLSGAAIVITYPRCKKS